MKHISKSAKSVFDALAVIGLLLFSVWVVFISLLVGPGYWGSTIGLLTHAGAIGAMLYILQDLGAAAQIFSIMILILGWFFGLIAIVFGFAPGNFLELHVALPKAIMFLYPLIFLLGISKKKIGINLFKWATVLYIGLAGGIFISLASNIQIMSEAPGDIIAAVTFFSLLCMLLFIVTYPLYRLLRTNGVSMQQ